MWGLYIRITSLLIESNRLYDNYYCAGDKESGRLTKLYFSNLCDDPNSISPTCLMIGSTLNILMMSSLSPSLPQASPTDLRHFDPTLTSIPPTIADLVGTERSLHIEGFDYIAPISNGDSDTKLDSTIVESHRTVSQTKGESPGNFEDTLDESHEQHRPISEQIRNGKSTAGYTFEVTVEVNES